MIQSWPKERRKTISLVIIFLIFVVASIICLRGEKDWIPILGRTFPYDGKELKVLVANDVPVLPWFAAGLNHELGFKVEVERGPDTPTILKQLSNGELQEQFDATWLASSPSENLGYEDLLGDSYKLGVDSLGLMVKSDDLKRLKWGDKEVSWKDVEDAVLEGELNFGIADPGDTELGKQSLLSILYEVCGVQPDDLDSELADEKVSKLKRFFAAQGILGDSEEDLFDQFDYVESGTQAVFAKQSESAVMTELTDSEFVRIRDSVELSSHVLSVIKKQDNKSSEASSEIKTKALAGWIVQNPSEVVLEARLDINDSVQQLNDGGAIVDLPFDTKKSEKATRFYNEELRRPKDMNLLVGNTTTLDVPQLEEMKKDLLEELENEEVLTGGALNLTLLSASPDDRLVAKSYSTRSKQQTSAVSDFLRDMGRDSEDDIYGELSRELLRLGRDGNLWQGQAIVLLTDGEVAEESRYQTSFDTALRDRRDGSPGVIPVFIVHYGNENAEEMQRLAEDTGGEVFKANEGGLAAALDRANSYWAA
ncbi:hypothetical protein [uncultured Corynebacterium sp.]|uniref:hypothetical protein n=1 Tax=uncultured Corynebacterium sp. TaxID=159447 RepID=UPI0025D521DA|nr:hypothetical protein [uncultured Corynebacterium sp.]